MAFNIRMLILNSNKGIYNNNNKTNFFKQLYLKQLNHVFFTRGMTLKKTFFFSIKHTTPYHQHLYTKRQIKAYTNANTD